MNTQQDLESLQVEYTALFENAATIEVLETLHAAVFNRKQGKLSLMLRSLKDINDVAERKQVGELANTIKMSLEDIFTTKKATLNKTVSSLNEFDPTLPGKAPQTGHLHPLHSVQNELIDIFQSMGFSVFEGNELTDELYCFEYLNIPDTHPARDLQDTFYVNHEVNGVKYVMRTHTSNMQVKIMENTTPPLRAIVPGRVFRNEATDASHEHTFYQMEGFVVDKNISIANLTYVLKIAMSKILRQSVQIRLRPGYFPYVEPGFEVDCSCTQCQGKGCAVCKRTGWVEMLGCGMIHPKVFASAGYAPGAYTGFAFGVGINRLAMLKYGIDHIRGFTKGDLRFINQF